MNELADVKPGDKVIMRQMGINDGGSVCTVTRTTKTMIFTDNGFRFRRDGTEVGGSRGFWRRVISAANPEQILKCDELTRKNRLVGTIRDWASLHERVSMLSLETLEKINELISGAKHAT